MLQGGLYSSMPTYQRVLMGSRAITMSPDVQHRPKTRGIWHVAKVDTVLSFVITPRVRPS